MNMLGGRLRLEFSMHLLAKPLLVRQLWVAGLGLAVVLGGDDPVQTPDVGRAGSQAVELTNAFRKEQGLTPVKANAQLMATAQEFAAFMARTGKYGHEADGRTPADRAKAQGYSYAVILENIGWASDSRGFETEALATKFVEGWKHSPPHRKNMVDPDVVETGVAIAKGADDPENGAKYYAVQMFGRPESMMVRFRIENRTGKTVSYTITAGGETTKFDLPVRMVREHSMGRVPTVKVAGAAGDAIEAKTGELLTVKAGEGGAMVVDRGGGS